MPIPANKTKADVVLHNYYANNWVDSQTRMVVFQFTIWNSNLDQFAVCRVLFEFPAIGPIRASKRVLVMTQRVVTMMGAANTSEMIANIMDVVVICFLLYYIAEEVNEYYRCLEH